jgi:hypothetical protein
VIVGDIVTRAKILLTASLTGWLCAVAPAGRAAAQTAEAAPPAPPLVQVPATSDADALEQIHRASLHTRRSLADAVFIAGLVSIAGGGALIVPDGDDQAWRYAGVNTAIFGAVNTVVSLLALHGIAKEEDEWEAEPARAARRTPEGLARARIHAVIDERRESVGHAINLGLNCAYLGIAGTATLASQLGVDHPNRWLASGAAIGFQALFLLGIDFIGLTRSAQYHRAFAEGLAPSLAITPNAAGTEMRAGFGGTF